jgi:hypothetical protein
MKTLQTKTQIREAVLKASAVDLNGQTFSATKNNAGFVNNDRFIYRDTLFNAIMKNNLNAVMNETKLYLK